MFEWSLATFSVCLSCCLETKLFEVNTVGRCGSTVWRTVPIISQDGFPRTAEEKCKSSSLLSISRDISQIDQRIRSKLYAFNIQKVSTDHVKRTTPLDISLWELLSKSNRLERENIKMLAEDMLSFWCFLVLKRSDFDMIRQHQAAMQHCTQQLQRWTHGAIQPLHVQPLRTMLHRVSSPLVTLFFSWWLGNLLLKRNLYWVLARQKGRFYTK